MNLQEQNPALIQIGKKGISEELIINIKKNLARNKLVKIKFLKNLLGNNDREQVKESVLKKLSNLEIEHKLVGNTLFIKRIKKW